MDPLFLRKKLINSRINQARENIKTNKLENNTPVDKNQPSEVNVQKQAENVVKNIRAEMLEPTQLKMNYLASMERSGYIKKVLNLPKTLPELLMQLQNEDTIADDQVEEAEKILIGTIKELYELRDTKNFYLPKIFIISSFLF